MAHRMQTAILFFGSIGLAFQPAIAQTVAGQSEGREVVLAEECLLELNRIAKNMHDDEFWLVGWGYGVQPAPQSTEAPATSVTSAPGRPDPRGGVSRIDAPRIQIRALYSAARVLAHQGKQEGCENIVGHLSDTYDAYSQNLRDAGLDPASVTTWRQEKLALAQPLSEVQGMTSYRIDDITGTDVRNLEDEYLGSVSDVHIDPNSGATSYVIVARAGILGIGEEYIAVPWAALHATPGLASLVINRSVAELENAPTIDREEFSDVAIQSEVREQIDEFWKDRG